MSRELEIRKVLPSDFEKLSSLYARVFGVQRDNDFWNWKYFRNPHGEPLTFVALDGGEVVGEVGSVPVRVQCGQETFPAAQTCDIAILPEYQKKGVFFRLYGESTREHVRRNILFIYGFSIPKTLEISTTLLEFLPVCPVRRWVLILNPAPYIAKKFHSSLLGRMAGPLARFFVRSRLRGRDRAGRGVTEIFQFDERFDRFWEERKNDHEIMVVRNSEYLNWRYADHPKRLYRTLACFSGDRVKGFIVLTTAVNEVRRGMIMDMMVDPADGRVLDDLLSAAVGFFDAEKIDNVMSWLPDRHRWVQEYERWGFVRKETAHHLIVRGVSPAERGIDSGSFAIPGRWHFSLGDSDYH